VDIYDAIGEWIIRDADFAINHTPALAPGYVFRYIYTAAFLLSNHSKFDTI